MHTVLGELCKTNGFRKTKSGRLAYYKPFNGKYLTFWFQCDRWGWDRYAGSRFLVEFQLDESVEPGRSRGLASFLTPEELEQVRTRQNWIIRKIPPPPQEWVDVFEAAARRSQVNPENILDGFWQQWRLIEEPYQPNHLLWLRYWDSGDVEAWARFVVGVLPRIIAEIGNRGM